MGSSSSLATNPALTYFPSPSLSPFSPMSELSFSLASDPKSLKSPLYSTTASSNFAEFVPLDVSKLNLMQQDNLCHPFSIVAQPQPMSSLPGQDVKLLQEGKESNILFFALRSFFWSGVSIF